MRKGILLAGGTQTHLHPLTSVNARQLLPVFDKPMIYYPLSTLMLAGIREILIISNPEDRPAFQKLLGSGRQWGLSLDYATQPSQEGLVQALVVGKDFLDGGPSCLVLGDNLVHGHGLPKALRRANEQINGATIFTHHVENPEQYNIVNFGPDGRVTSVDDKPHEPRPSRAVIGLYFYDGAAGDLVADLELSTRGDDGITALNNFYLAQRRLTVEQLGRGYAWFDARTHDSLLEAAEFVRVLQSRQGRLIAAPEEIAFRQSWIDRDAFEAQAQALSDTKYGRLLQSLLHSDATATTKSRPVILL